MKLYEAPRDSYVKLPEGEVINFKHIDGMYSFCCIPAGICHVKAWTEVEIVTKEDYFEYWKNK